jgi:hypothetical protein
MGASVDVARLAESLSRASSRPWYAQVAKADKLSRVLRQLPLEFPCRSAQSFQAPGEVFVNPGQSFELRLHLSFQGKKFGLVTLLALFGEGLEGFALTLVDLLPEGVALLQNPNVELELLLALFLAALEPAAEDSRKAALPPMAVRAVRRRSASWLMREAREIFRQKRELRATTRVAPTGDCVEWDMVVSRWRRRRGGPLPGRPSGVGPFVLGGPPDGQAAESADGTRNAHATLGFVRGAPGDWRPCRDSGSMSGGGLYPCPRSALPDHPARAEAYDPLPTLPPAGRGSVGNALTLSPAGRGSVGNVLTLSPARRDSVRAVLTLSPAGRDSVRRAQTLSEAVFRFPQRAGAVSEQLEHCPRSFQDLEECVRSCRSPIYST